MTYKQLCNKKRLDISSFYFRFLYQTYHAFDLIAQQRVLTCLLDHIKGAYLLVDRFKKGTSWMYHIKTTRDIKRKSKLTKWQGGQNDRRTVIKNRKYSLNTVVKSAPFQWILSKICSNQLNLKIFPKFKIQRLKEK